MARVLISEPDPQTRTLLELLILRLGHRPIGERELAAGREPELLILEPASPQGLRQAHALRRRLGRIPIVCVSVLPSTEEIRALEPVAYLLKPFRRSELDHAVARALATRPPRVLELAPRPA